MADPAAAVAPDKDDPNPGREIPDVVTDPNATSSDSTGIIGSAKAGSTDSGMDNAVVGNNIDNVTTFDAEQVELDDTETVAGQVNKIIAEDSPLMQQAATKGLQAANSRGLANSSMAAQASQAAVLDAATAIGSQDAQAILAAKQANAAAVNAARSQQAAAENQFRSQEETQRFQAEQAELTRENEVLMQKLDHKNQKKITKLTNDNARVLQASQTAGLIQAQTSASIAEISANPEIPEDRKTVLINQQIDLLESSLAMQGTILDVNLDDILDFGGSSGATGGIVGGAKGGYDNGVTGPLNIGPSANPNAPPTGLGTPRIGG